MKSYLLSVIIVLIVIQSLGCILMKIEGHRKKKEKQDDKTKHSDVYEFNQLPETISEEQKVELKPYERISDLRMETEELGYPIDFHPLSRFKSLIK